jgi:hypothetical protein
MARIHGPWITVLYVVLLLHQPVHGQNDSMATATRHEPFSDTTTHQWTEAHLFFDALMILVAYEAQMNTYRRCDPMPFESPLGQRVFEYAKEWAVLAAACMDGLGQRIGALLSFSPATDTRNQIRHLIHTFLDFTPLSDMALFLCIELPLDIAAQLVLGEPIFIPRTPEGYCYVYCGKTGTGSCVYV